MVERAILPGIGDVLLEVESVISVGRLDISRSRLAKDSYQEQKQGDGRRDWRNASSVNERDRKTNTNNCYVDSDAESGQNSTPNYVFSVGIGWAKRVEW